MTRGALYIVWPGDPRTEYQLARSRASLEKWHPELPVHVHELPEGSNLLDKSDMIDFSPFDETLYIDADTVVLGRLDYAFDKAVQHGIAVCICEAPWARRFAGMADMGDIIEYNTGLLWWSKKGEPVMREWQRVAREVDSSILFKSKRGLQKMPNNDQAGFSLAVENLGFNPWVLPLNWNFRPIWQRTCFGPIKIWHDYSEVPDNVLEWCDEQSRPDAMVGFAQVQEPSREAVLA